MRCMDVMLSIPGLLLAIGIVAVLGPGFLQIMIAVGVVNIPIFARLLRGSVLAQRENDFVLAARADRACRARTILSSHILPNSISPVIVQGTLALATAIIDVAGLGFLGLGPPDPATPEWGTMLSDVNRYFVSGAAPRDRAGLRDRPLRARLQPDRRRAPRGARPEAARPVSLSPRAEPLLAVEDLHVEFWTSRGLVHAVNGITFEIAPGETLGIVGESGCGKSVTSLALLGILSRSGQVTGGTAMFEGRDLLTLPDAELRKIRGREIAMIFQDPMTSLNPVLTVGRQIREALETHFDMDKKAANARRGGAARPGRHPAARRSRLKDYPHQFSGGMRQRAMIAMALACEPKLLIADEPTTALDVTIQAQILELLHDARRGAGHGADPDHARPRRRRRHCERVNVMYAGMFVETGSAEAALRPAAPPVHAGPAAVDPAPRRRAQGGADADRGRPARHAAARRRACPFQPRCRYEVEQSRQEVPPLARDRAGPLRRLLQPGAGGRVAAIEGGRVG